MFCFDKNSKIPIYQQLYEQLSRQIIEGLLPKDSKLPPTRKLSAEYKISRNTVTQAYQQLEIEGYVRGKIGSGFYVEDLSSFQQYYCPPKIESSITKNINNNEFVYDFNYGNLDYNCYQTKAWRRSLINAYDFDMSQKTITYCDAMGLPELRNELARYLNYSRGVRCSAEQIIITSGHQHSLEIIARLFSSDEWNFAMEDPGYNATRTVMKQNGFSPIAISLEDNGIKISDIKFLSHALLYVTPSHQFPMGCVLPISKRLNLLKWANENDSYILEDDYDSELRYHSLPIPSMQSIDNNERTIYLGTLSKSMSPEMRMAYLVLPKHLIDTYHKLFLNANSSVSTLCQYALTDFFQSGEYQKHINAMRMYYQKKHDYILNFFKENFAGKAELLGENAGLHFIMNLKNSVSIEEFYKSGIKLYPLSPYWSNLCNNSDNQFLLGYGSIPLEKLSFAMDAVKDVLDSY